MLRASRNTALILVVSAVAAAVCVRLGVWQVARLQERRAHNSVLVTRLAGPVAAVESLPTDTGAGHYRLASASGSMWYEREVVWAPRAHEGSPGVNFLTPMRRPGSDTVVMIDRGWAYSPDAKSVDFARWREADTLQVSGYVETWTHGCGAVDGTPLSQACGDSALRVMRRLDRRAAERLVGAPVAPYILMQTSDSALRADSVPVRVGRPALGEGPHRGYAFQWFGFATIALVGGIALARRSAGRRRHGDTRPPGPASDQ